MPNKLGKTLETAFYGACAAAGGLVTAAAGIASTYHIQRLIDCSSNEESFKSALILVPATLIYGAITKKFMNKAKESYSELEDLRLEEEKVMRQTRKQIKEQPEMIHNLPNLVYGQR